VVSLQDRNGWFHAFFRYAGRQVSFALKTQSKKEAEAARGTIERSLRRVRDGELAPPPDGVNVAQWLLSGGRPVEPVEPAKPPTAQPAVTLQALAEQYLAANERALEANTLATARVHFRHLRGHFGDEFNVASLTVAGLQGYLAARPVSAATLRLEISTLRTAWNWADLGRFPNKGLRYPKADDKPPFMTRAEIERRGGGAALWECLFLTREDVADLLGVVASKATAPWLAPMVAFAAYTGARRSELLRVQVADVDLDARTVLIREQKRKRGQRSTRRVPLSAALHRVLSDWLAVHPGGSSLFCQAGTVRRSKKRSATTGHRGERTRCGTVAGRAAGVRRRDAVEPAAITKDEAHDHLKRTLAGTAWSVLRGWHVLRHSFISICASEGVDPRMLRAWVGHVSEETHRRYTHLIPSQEQAAIGRVFGG